MSYLKVSDLSFYYDQEKVLDKINFEIQAGEFVILTGENGAAKSTLVKNILGLLKPSTGKIELAKKNIHGDKLTIGYIAQNINSFNAGFPSTVQRFVESGRYVKHRWFKRLDAHDQAHVDRALESVGMTQFRHKKIGELSGVRNNGLIWRELLLLILTSLFSMNRLRGWILLLDGHSTNYFDIVAKSMIRQF